MGEWPPAHDPYLNGSSIDGSSRAALSRQETPYHCSLICHLGKRARFAAGLIIEHVSHDGGAEKLPTAEPIRMRRCHVGSTLVTRNCYKTCIVFCMERFLAEKTNIAWERGCPPKG